MTRSKSDRIARFVDREIEQSAEVFLSGDSLKAFHHLERAHVVGQASTYHHTRVHVLMLKHGWKTRNWQEVFGQLIRIVGAATKTPLGIYPTGNTGGSNVYFFKRMPIPSELQEVLADHGDNG